MRFLAFIIGVPLLIGAVTQIAWRLILGSGSLTAGVITGGVAFALIAFTLLRSLSRGGI